MIKSRKSDYTPHLPPDAAPLCEMAGCGEAGVYKAPKSKDDLHDYRWLCLNHIREHNQAWDFFAGFDREQIEAFIKDATVGHRPTWSRESLKTGRSRRQLPEQLQEALYEFLHMGKRAPSPTPPLPGRLRKALATLGVDYPCTPRQLKAQYRTMVKKYHPDVNKGDKQSEEKFKQITAAYHALSEHVKNA